MDGRESREMTIGMGCFAFASVALFVAVYTPLLWSVAPGRGIRPMTPLPLFAAMLGMGGWMPCVVVGVRQCFTRPRHYGMITIGSGALQAVAFWTAEWVLMRSRGIHWGS